MKKLIQKIDDSYFIIYLTFYFSVTFIIAFLFIGTFLKYDNFRRVVFKIYPIAPHVILIALLVILILKGFKLQNQVVTRIISHLKLLYIKLNNRIWFRWGHRALISAMGICLFVMPIFLSWHTLYNQNTLFGIFPASDGGGYYNGAKELLSTGKLSIDINRRPVNTSFYAVRLALVDQDYRKAIILQGIILATCCLILYHIIALTLDRSSALLFFILLFLFGKKYVASPLTEPLGLSLGALSFGVVWYSIKEKKIFYFALGIFIFMVSQSVRPGLLFIFPAIMIWFLVSNKAFNKKKMFNTISLLFIAFFGFFINSLIIYLYGNKISLGQDNLVCIIYSMSKGEDGWESHKILSDEQKNDLWEETYKEIKKNPVNLLISMKKRIKSFAFQAIKEMILTISIWSDKIIINEEGKKLLYNKLDLQKILEVIGLNQKRIIDIIINIFFLLSGIYFIIKNRFKEEYRFILFTTAGIFLSGFIIGNVDVKRIIQPSLPFILIIYSLGFYNISKNNEMIVDTIEGPASTKAFANISIAIFMIIFMSIIIGPIISSKYYQKNDQRININQDSNNLLITEISNKMPHLKILKEDIGKISFIPEITFDEFKNAMILPYNEKDKYGFKKLLDLNPPKIIALAFKLSGNRSGDGVYIVGDIDLLSDNWRLVKLYGKYIHDPMSKRKIFYIEKYEEI